MQRVQVERKQSSSGNKNDESMESGSKTNSRVRSKSPTDSARQTLEKNLLGVLPVDESGFMVYPGTGSTADRTGAPIRRLLDWILYEKGEAKPIDASVFKDYLETELGVDLRSYTMTKNNV